MLENSHTRLVADLCKPGAEIRASLSDRRAHLVHMILGISGEAGELLDSIKKTAIYGKPLDRGNIVEELGDLEFYMKGLRESLGITRDETLKHNIEKLRKRYGETYTNQAAIDRVDKEKQPTHPDLRP